MTQGDKASENMPLTSPADTDSRPPSGIDQQIDSKQTLEVVVAPVVPADGGLRAWLSVAGGFLVMFSIFGYSNSFGVYQDYYVLAHASSVSNISWIGSLQLCLMFGMGLPAGKLFDMGYFHYTSVIGSLLYVFSMFMLSLANPHKYYQLILSQGIGMGLGSGLLLAPTMSVQSHHWRKHRSFAMGIVMSGTGAGGIIYPIMLNRLIQSKTGFAWGVRATAFLTLGLLAIANCIMTTRPITKPQGAPKPTFSTILTDIPYMLTLFCFFLILWGLFFPYFYLQLWVNLHGLSSTLALYTIAILNAGSLLGRTLPNLLADHTGQFTILAPLSIIAGALIFAMFGITSDAAVIVFSLIYGFFSGAVISLIPPTAASMSRGIHEIGLRLGFAFFVSSFAMLTGTPIIGALYDQKGEWYRPILFSAIVMLAGGGLATISRQLFVRRKGTWRV